MPSGILTQSLYALVIFDMRAKRSALPSPWSAYTTYSDKKEMATSALENLKKKDSLEDLRGGCCIM